MLLFASKLQKNEISTNCNGFSVLTYPTLQTALMILARVGKHFPLKCSFCNAVFEIIMHVYLKVILMHLSPIIETSSIATWVAWDSVSPINRRGKEREKNPPSNIDFSPQCQTAGYSTESFPDILGVWAVYMFIGTLYAEVIGSGETNWLLKLNLYTNFYPSTSS